MGPYMALIVPSSFYEHWRRIACTEFFSKYNYLQKDKLFTDEFHYLKWIMKCIDSVYIMGSYIQSEEWKYWFKGLAEIINKLIFNNLHNPPPTKYFDIIINPLLVEVYKIAKMYIEYVVYSPFLALSV